MQTSAFLVNTLAGRVTPPTGASFVVQRMLSPASLSRRSDSQPAVFHAHHITKIDESQDAPISKYLENAPPIQHLSLSAPFPQTLGDEGSHLYEALLKHASTLESLSLQNFHLDPVHLSDLLARLSLRRLHLSDSITFDDEAMKLLVPALGKSASLSFLRLKSLLLTENSADSVAELLAQKPLIAADLSALSFDNAAPLAGIGHSLAQDTSSLRALLLKGSSLDTDITSSILTGVARNQRLVHLDLSDNKYTSATLPAVLEVVKQNNTIQSLDMRSPSWLFELNHSNLIMEAVGANEGSQLSSFLQNTHPGLEFHNLHQNRMSMQEQILEGSNLNAMNMSVAPSNMASILRTIRQIDVPTRSRNILSDNPVSEDYWYMRAVTPEDVEYLEHAVATANENVTRSRHIFDTEAPSAQDASRSINLKIRQADLAADTAAADLALRSAILRRQNVAFPENLFAFNAHRGLFMAQGVAKARGFETLTTSEYFAFLSSIESDLFPKILPQRLAAFTPKLLWNSTVYNLYRHSSRMPLHHALYLGMRVVHFAQPELPLPLAESFVNWDQQTARKWVASVVGSDFATSLEGGLQLLTFAMSQDRNILQQEPTTLSMNHRPPIFSKKALAEFEKKVKFETNRLAEIDTPGGQMTICTWRRLNTHGVSALVHLGRDGARNALNMSRPERLDLQRREKALVGAVRALIASECTSGVLPMWVAAFPLFHPLAYVAQHVSQTGTVPATEQRGVAKWGDE
ncbi:hypothetical protein H696_02862 [Fonticula alba]|uniref:Uncharacterized protein n=1 Tax=Fonticula alba TaxID=691883 RepID=A0A058Z9E4_FONAL|nr:hypothetical protein H696_02862 [Fonticula alba]KCV70513.1 hypothetical protein H696_02862 [Fonticula alba]|eukprot:XP_009495029.1 hypothetical protein H696_02862 [Fonticula alba]